MDIIIKSQCLMCNNFDGNKSWTPMFVCKAYIGGIPKNIYMNKHDHTEPYKGDNGIQFEPIEK